MVLPEFDTSKRPQLPPPFINLGSLPNLRDVGGLPIAHQKAAVRRRVLYRSADPSRLTLDDLKTLHQELGVCTIFDLRSEPEIQRAGTLSAWTALLQQYNASVPTDANPIERVWAPVFQTEDYSPESIAKRYASYGSSDGVEGFVWAYTQILTHLGPTLRTVLNHLTSSSTPRGILVHCTAGKDRAGNTIAVILSLLGVSDESIAVDYNLTEAGLSHLRPLFVERSKASGAFGPPDDEKAGQAAFRMTGAQKEAMLATLTMIRERWGSVESYVKEVVGVDQNVLDKLRATLVVEAQEP